MPLEIRERTLPGVGIRYEVDLTSEKSVAVVIHNTGQRDLYQREDRDDDYEKVIELSDSQARALGLLLVGAYYQPIASSAGDTSPTDQRVKWYQISQDSVALDEPLSSIDIPGETGGAVLAVVRDGSRIVDPDGEFVLRAGDNVVAIGTQTQHDQMDELLSTVDSDLSP